MDNQMMVTDNHRVVDTKVLTAAEIRANVNLIQEVMKAVMQDGQHYGKVPGCGPKPTLLKPGAEKLAATFRLAADPIVEDLSGPDAKRFRVLCRLVHMTTGAFCGAGIGECSSDEEKYKWKKAFNTTEWESTPEDRRREKWVRTKEGKEFLAKQIRTNPADVANTVLKMAKKRALVDAVLTATAASDIFTQDIEEMSDTENEVHPIQNGPTTAAIPETKKTQEPKNELPERGTMRFVPKEVKVHSDIAKNGKNAGKPYTVHGVVHPDGLVFKTFDKNFGAIAQGACAKREAVEIDYVKTKYGYDIEAIENMDNDAIEPPAESQTPY